MFELFTAVYDFITVGIYDYTTEALDFMVIKLEVAFYSIKELLISFGWSIISEVLTTFDVSGTIQEGFNSVPSDIQNTLYFFRMPEVITNLLAGVIGRFVLRLIF